MTIASNEFLSVRTARRLAAFAGVALVACGLVSCGGEGASSPRSPDADEGSELRTNGVVSTVAARAERFTASLGRFLDVGPTAGTWSVKQAHHHVAWRFALHPTETESLLISRVGSNGLLAPIQVVPRNAVPRLFFEAPSWLFFANYEPEGPPSRAPLKDAENAVRIVWRPVHEGAGDTSRHAWFDAESATLIRVEDHSRAGRVVRSIWREPGVDDALAVPTEDVPPCCGRPVASQAADDLRRALAAPFPIYEPERLPAGYVRIRADYRACDLAASKDDGEAVPAGGKDGLSCHDGASPGAVRRATLLYSDGLGLISVVIAPRDELDAIVTHYGRLPPDGGDPEACTALPDGISDDVTGSAPVVRMREDTCRTILRRDDVDANVSVMLMGRNELPLAAYVRAISAWKRVTGQ